MIFEFLGLAAIGIVEDKEPWGTKARHMLGEGGQKEQGAWAKAEGQWGFREGCVQEGRQK